MTVYRSQQANALALHLRLLGVLNYDPTVDDK